MITTPKKCIIVDDEPAAHYVLTNYIRQNPQLELTAQCYNGIEALHYLRENTVDLMFLDIDMPEITGLELLQTLKNPPKTILTTAYSEFALESYEYGVIDYLLKPIYFPRFLKSIERYLSLQFIEKETATPIALNVKVNGKNIDIRLDDILYVQSYGNYVKIFTKTKTFVTAMTTNQLVQELPSDKFMRVHKSYIIAIHKIDVHEKEHIVINEEKIPLGITFRRELNERLRPLS